jgi:uncharacterized protein YndB with AHSA1/START domain
MMGKTNLIAEPGKQEILVTRVFDASPKLVFKAYTDPDLIRQWLGPRRMTMTIKQMDVRPGGSWRYVHSDPEGNEYGFHGVFHAVVPHERLVQTFEFEGVPGHVSLDTAIFEAMDGKTKVTLQSVFQSVEDRDGMVASGMEEGMNEGLDRLDEVLKELQKAGVPAR